MAPSNPVRTDPWAYVDGETLTPAAASTPVTVPPNANIFEIAANGEDVYYRINGPAAGTAAPGFIVAGGREIVGPLSNLNSLHVYQIAGGTTHIQWFLQKKTTKS